MRTNPDFIKRKIAGENLLVPVGEAAKEMNGMVRMNATAVFIWENINDCEHLDDLVKLICENFDVDEETATKDARDSVVSLFRAGMLIE